MDPILIADRLAKYFTPHVLIDNVPAIEWDILKKKYRLDISLNMIYTGIVKLMYLLDITFVKQLIGHSKIDIIFRYIENLSENEHK